MSDDTTVQTMTEDECWERLEGEEFGRLATGAVGEVSITPVNYVVKDRQVVIRTTEGSKLTDLVVQSRVAFEIDKVDGETAWSVIGKGDAHVVQSFDESYDLEQLGLRPWVDTDKDVWVVVTLDDVSGRTFALTR